MVKLPQISEAEFEVMKIIWKKAPASTNDITDALVKTTKWQPKTIQDVYKRQHIPVCVGYIALGLCCIDQQVLFQ